MQDVVDRLLQHGLLKDTEAEHILEDLQKAIRHVLVCKATVHPGEFAAESDENNLVEEARDAS
jgi:hypothetical protein